MMPPISAEVSETVTTAMPQITAAVLEALVSTMEANLAREQAVVERKLSGEVLQSRSGRLLGSVRIDPPSLDGDILTGALEAGQGAPEGWFNEFGTRGPYVIEARVAKALAFEVGGETVFAKHVVHPGLPARSFMGSTAEELRQQEANDYQAAVAAALA